MANVWTSYDKIAYAHIGRVCLCVGVFFPVCIVELWFYECHDDCDKHKICVLVTCNCVNEKLNWLTWSYVILSFKLFLNHPSALRCKTARRFCLIFGSFAFFPLQQFEKCWPWIITNVSDVGWLNGRYVWCQAAKLNLKKLVVSRVFRRVCFTKCSILNVGISNQFNYYLQWWYKTQFAISWMIIVWVYMCISIHSAFRSHLIDSLKNTLRDQIFWIFIEVNIHDAFELLFLLFWNFWMPASFIKLKMVENSYDYLNRWDYSRNPNTRKYVQVQEESEE